MQLRRRSQFLSTLGSVGSTGVILPSGSKQPLPLLVRIPANRVNDQISPYSVNHLSELPKRGTSPLVQFCARNYKSSQTL